MGRLPPARIYHRRPALYRGPEEPEEGIEEAGLVLGDLITKAKSKFSYGYDFGDGWQHTVMVDKMANIPEDMPWTYLCRWAAAVPS